MKAKILTFAGSARSQSCNKMLAALRAEVTARLKS